MLVSHRHQVTTTPVDLIDTNKYLQPLIASIVVELHLRAIWFADSMESAGPRTSALANGRGLLISHVAVSPLERFFRLPNTPHPTHGIQSFLRHRQVHARHEQWRQFLFAPVLRHSSRICVDYTQACRNVASRPCVTAQNTKAVHHCFYSWSTRRLRAVMMIQSHQRDWKDSLLKNAVLINSTPASFCSSVVYEKGVFQLTAVALDQSRLEICETSGTSNAAAAQMVLRHLLVLSYPLRITQDWCLA